MQKKHSFSPNHKVVDGPHNFHPHGKPGTASMGAPPKNLGDPDGDGDVHTSAEPAGGGAQGPGMNFCNGGMKYADGGDILGGGWRGKMADYGSAIKQTAKDLTGMGNPVKKAQGDAQEATNNKIDQAVKDAGG
jgi:hypothetical protein